MTEYYKSFPNYDDDSDYNTNANSYYKDLGRKTKLIKLLAKRIWEYENTLNETFEQIEKRLTDYILENDTLMSERLENWGKRIDEMPEEMRSLFVTWLNDGTLEQIINHDVLGEKVDQAELDQILTFDNYEIQNKTRKKEALFTIWDDDSTTEAFTKLRPIQQEFNIPMSTAVITNWIDKTNGMTKDQLLQLVDDGWEVTVHSQNHVNLSTLSLNEQVAQMQGALDDLKGWGIDDVTTIAYPFSGHNDNTVLAGRQFFRAGRTTDYGINRPPFQTWDLQVMNSEKGATLESLKRDIDDIADNGGWGIYLTHANVPEAIGMTHIREIIQYVQSKGIEIVTVNEALNRMGNLIDVGRYWEEDLTKPHHVVGADGSTSSHSNPSTIVKPPERALTGSMLPSDFEKGKIYINETHSTSGFYGSEFGTLFVNTLSEGNYYQELIARGSELHLLREQNGEQWGQWQLKDNNKVEWETEVTIETPLSYFEVNAITTTFITSDNSDSFPNGQGVLLTNTFPRNDAAKFQEYYPNSVGHVYKRKWTGNGWADWQRLTPTYATSNSSLRNWPVDRMQAGEMYFSTTNNQPIWRNANNDGWVDAMGSSITL